MCRLLICECILNSETAIWTPTFDYVAGRVQRPSKTLPISLCDPNTGQKMLPQVESDGSAVEEALEVAWQVHRERRWSSIDLSTRKQLLFRIATILAGRAEALSRLSSATTGLVLRQTQGLARLLPKVFEVAALQMEKHSVEHFPGAYGAVEQYRAPLGPALCITPWNAPGVIAAHKIASALAAGCPVIIKPSEWAPHVTNAIAQAIHEAELPPGVFQLLHGGATVGARLVADQRIKAVSFTGGLAGGRAIGRVCAEQLKPAQLELGGNNPMVVFSGADIDHTAKSIVTSMTLMNGQWCRALGRLLVERPLLAPLLDRVAYHFQQLTIGSSLREESEMGPLIHSGHIAQLKREIAALCSKGGRAASFAPLPPGNGNFLSPTLVLGCAPADTVSEIFGPVAAVHTFESKSEAMHLVHQTPYGLAAYVFGPEKEALDFARDIEAGMVKVNGVTLTSLHPATARDAWGLSGLGVEGAAYTYSFFTGHRVVGVAYRGS